MPRPSFCCKPSLSRAAVALLVALALPFALGQGTPPAEAPLPPDLEDVAYDVHPQTVLDLWQAEGEGPRPLLVTIHGGGWRGGNKALRASQVAPYLEQGISVASIAYRLAPAHPLPAPVHDAARAIQTLRHRAAEWNLDPDRVALIGGSAGACTAMWLLFREDLADPAASDPVARESTRVAAAVALSGQTSIDPKVIEPWLGPMVLAHPMIHSAVGAPDLETALADYERHADLYREFSPINHVSPGDPPLLMAYGRDLDLPAKDARHGIHHPVFGLKMQEACLAAGVECHLLIPGASRSERYPDPAAFLLDKLLAPPP